MKSNKFYQIIYVYKKMLSISKRLNSLDCASCNGTIEDYQYDRRVKSLEVKAEKLAKLLKMRVYHQTDPRGCSLYICEPKHNNQMDYTQHGFAVC